MGPHDIRPAVNTPTAVNAPSPDAGRPGNQQPAGHHVLDEVASVLGRFVVFPSEHEAITVALFITHTYLTEAADFSPYLHVTSAERRSGKTTLIELISELAAHPFLAASASPAAIYRGLNSDDIRRTLILDEVDTIFVGRKSSDVAEALRQVLNAGTRRGSALVRRSNERGGLESFDVFGPKVLAGIGDLPETLRDRAIRIRLKRKLPTETVDRARYRDLHAAALPVKERIAAWTESIGDNLGGREPELPSALSDRMQDAWEPLVALADVAGGEWSARARHAAVALYAEAEDRGSAEGLRLRLLRDCHEVFGTEQRLATQELLARLRRLDEAPWSSLDGRGLEPPSLARMLRPYEIAPRKIRFPEQDSIARGYLHADFVDAWARYCGISPTPRMFRNIRNTQADVPRVPGVPPSQGGIS